MSGLDLILDPRPEIRLLIHVKYFIGHAPTWFCKWFAQTCFITRIEEIILIFQTSDPKSNPKSHLRRKVFDFGQNLQKVSMLYLKHFRSIEFLPITFEKYLILDQHIWTMWFRPQNIRTVSYLHWKHGKRYCVSNQNIWKVSYFESKHSERSCSDFKQVCGKV